MRYEPVIGLEIHIELKTRTKMFCDTRNDPDERQPNVNVCPICLGHPGTLPTINIEAVKKVIQIGLALHGDISEFSQFDRKNYFYPDLPKGYQISQYEHPIVRGGWLELLATAGQPKRIRLQRIHLEEDTGRSIHDPAAKTTLLDFNRAGIPLLELVTEPDLSSGAEVKQFGTELQKIIRHLNASDANMEKGEMRVEVNISLRPTIAPTGTLGTKVELKNINSFRFAADAIDYEVKRQGALLANGETIVQETRGWDEKHKVTVSQRLKEESHDYRYFPEPDLPPLKIEPSVIELLRRDMPELPQEKYARFQKEFGIDKKIAEIIVQDKDLANYFEKAVSELREWLSSRGETSAGRSALSVAANYLTNDLSKLLSDSGATIQECRVTPENFAELITYIVENRISSRTAKMVLAEMFKTGADPSIIIDEKKLWQVSEATPIDAAVTKIITANPNAVADYRSGKIQTLQFLVGQVMKEVGGANPDEVKNLLKEKLQ